MRLWHKDLISVLPDKQLIGQWRECCAIARNIAVKGTPNHLLVNKVMDYPIEHFHYYANLIVDEMQNRGFNYNYGNFRKWIDLNENHTSFKKLFGNWHNGRYMMQCFMNLQEKYDCGGISEDEWQVISNFMWERYGKL